MRGRARSHFFGLLCAPLLGFAGCNGDGEGSISLFGEPKSTATAKAAGSKELTLEQGRKLLEEIRKNPKRLEKLTPQERQFIARAGFIAQEPEE